MLDIASQLKAIHRTVSRSTVDASADGGEIVRLTLTRSYDTGAADLWTALTDPERVRRWFLPLSGNLKVGGSFQLEGNAGGDILDCEPPDRLRVTFGGPASIVELRLSEASGSTTLVLEHTVPIEMAGSGAGALYVGPGWDGAFLALALHIDGEGADDPVAAAGSPEGREFSRRSVQAWAETVESSGTATADELAAAAEVARQQFDPAG